LIRLAEAGSSNGIRADSAHRVEDLVRAGQLDDEAGGSRKHREDQRILVSS